MKDGICPKCSSDAIYISQPRRNRIQAGKHIIAKQGAWIAHYVDLTHYGCAHCGYVEAYASDERSIEHMQRFWKPFEHKRKRDEADETE